MKRWLILLLIIITFILGYLARILVTPTTPPISIAEKTEAKSIAEKTETKPRFWTCSMHPQIKLSKPGKCPICFMDLVSVTGEEDSGAAHPSRLAMSEAAKVLAEIQTLPVERKSVIKTIRMVGKIEYDETRLAHISAWVPGRIDHLYIDYTGIPVKKGRTDGISIQPGTLIGSRRITSGGADPQEG